MKAFREKTGMNQTDFWGRVAVGQSAGSRYETGSCDIPAPVRKLVELAYGKKPLATLAKLRGCSVAELT